MSSSKVFVCSWDNLGFEAIVDFSDWYNNSVMSVLQDKGLGTPPANVEAMMMRARFNPQRNPEVWSFSTTEDLTEETLRSFAEENPQALVDLIRSRGKKLYGSKQPTAKNVIE